ncbi:hypothetical protein GQ597_09690 [Gilliamella sp. Pra-s65]|uniref:hypothetical protein n=1 Tax=unclassified Gilliamella TaxID=2685620 RepID=UPI0013666DF5|nr:MULTISPECIES: hypothetical protein [unclassified Gilliamella]MWN90973.1 hypothetical protein [Gilliamella sp. Pra-s65]MWP47705.1 hypothetical protein [Gilliamella sp. Pas-s27]MWP74094.1 hypothetical protein [Gilliamella sp. Pra-s52]
MRRLRFYIIIFLTIIWFLVLLSYFAIQTSFGAKIVSQQLSKLSSYTISIGSVRHSFSNFYELVFDNVIVRNDRQEVVHVPTLVIGLDKNRLWQLNHFNYVIVINGTINHVDKDGQFSHYSFSTNTLKLVDSTVNISVNSGQDRISFTQLNGGVKPFSLSTGSLSGEDKYQFDFTSQAVSVNQIPIKSLLIQGFHCDGITTVTNLGANIDNGFFVGKLKILADKHLNVDQLQLYNINLQSTDDDFWNRYSHILPNLTIKQLSIFESSIQVPNFLIEKGNVEATNLSYDEQWHFDQSAFVFNADHVVWDDEKFASVLIQLSSNDEEVEIKKALAKWNKGGINFIGKWKDNTLHLEQLTLSNINYQLPEKLELLALPSIFKSIKIDKLTVLQSLIIRKYSDFPFTLYNFQVSGTDVVLAKDHKLGLFSGSTSFKSEKGSFNRVDISYPDMVLKFDAENRALLTFSTLTSGGMIESNTKVDLSQNEPLSLQLNAYGVTSSLLEDWKLLKQPPTAMNYSVNLQGKLQPFSFSGVFSTDGNNYIIKHEH